MQPRVTVHDAAVKLDGPLLFLRRTLEVGLNEAVEVIGTDGRPRLGRVVTIDEGLITIEMLEPSAGLALADTVVRFRGAPVEFGVGKGPKFQPELFYGIHDSVKIVKMGWLTKIADDLRSGEPFFREPVSAEVTVVMRDDPARAARVRPRPEVAFGRRGIQNEVREVGEPLLSAFGSPVSRIHHVENLRNPSQVTPENAELWLDDPDKRLGIHNAA
jgi:hypothetical protein